MLLFSYCLGENSKCFQLCIGCTRVHNLSFMGKWSYRKWTVLLGIRIRGNKKRFWKLPWEHIQTILSGHPPEIARWLFNRGWPFQRADQNIAHYGAKMFTTTDDRRQRICIYCNKCSAKYIHALANRFCSTVILLVKQGEGRWREVLTVVTSNKSIEFLTGKENSQKIERM